MTDAELDAIEQRTSRNDVSRLAKEVRRLREVLEEITRLGQGHPVDSAVAVARAALTPPAGR
jgi:hypothetical protein